MLARVDGEEWIWCMHPIMYKFGIHKKAIKSRDWVSSQCQEENVANKKFVTKNAVKKTMHVYNNNNPSNRSNLFIKVWRTDV